MKKYTAIMLCILLYTFPAWGDDVDSGLGQMASEQVRSQTRAMINAGVPGDEAIKMTRMMIQHRFEFQQIVRAQQVVRNAIEEGIPPGPVMNKAFEGMAKNAGNDRIVQAMENVRNRYAYAYQKAVEITSAKKEKDAIAAAIAESLTAGINKSDVEQVMSRLQQRSRHRSVDPIEPLAKESFLSLQTMARRGVASFDATEVVCKALEHQYSSREMNQIRQTFRTQSLNTDPSRVAHQYAQSIQQGQSAGNIGKSMGGRHGGSDGGSGGSGGGSGGSDGGSGGSGGGSGGSDGGSGGSGGGSGGSDGGSGGSDGGSGGSDGGSGGSGGGSGGSGGGSGGSGGGSGGSGGGHG